MAEPDPVAEAIRLTLESPNESDSNFEPANVVDGLYVIARAITRLARAVERATGGTLEDQGRRPS